MEIPTLTTKINKLKSKISNEEDEILDIDEQIKLLKLKRKEKLQKVDTVHNHEIYKTVPFNSGNKVRILEDKDQFSKGKNKFSKEIYTVDDREGYKITLKNALGEALKRTLKPSELLKINAVENAISQTFIDRNKKAKANAKITTKLIRNEDMTKQEALQAKKQLKDNVLPPALSTRSNTRALRDRKPVNYKV